MQDVSKLLLIKGDLSYLASLKYGLNLLRNQPIIHQHFTKITAYEKLLLRNKYNEKKLLYVADTESSKKTIL